MFFIRLQMDKMYDLITLAADMPDGVQDSLIVKSRKNPGGLDHWMNFCCWIWIMKYAGKEQWIILGLTN